MKVHFCCEDTKGYRYGVCGHRYALGMWTNEERIERDPFFGAQSHERCMKCERWLLENKPEIFPKWKTARKKILGGYLVSGDPKKVEIAISWMKYEERLEQAIESTYNIYTGK